MDKKEAISFLKQSLSEVPKLAELPYNNYEYPMWYKTIEGVLEGVFGKDSSEYKNFSGARVSVYVLDREKEEYLKGLKLRETALLSIIHTHEILGIETKSTAIAGLTPKAFIAHGGESPALRKLKSFLEALGVQYLIAEVEPSDGRLVEPQVTRAYEHADFAIILATKGGVIDKNKGVYYMAMNVADELGRGREVFKNRIILLLETGVEPHTNISGIVYERFAPQSMDKAFIKIAKELKNWGFIRAGKAK